MSQKFVVGLFSVFLSVVLVSSCAAKSPAGATSIKTQTDVSLADHNWDPFNKGKLEMFMATYGKGSPGYNPERPPYAVFDWDNTMVFLDVAEATLIYQLENLRFAMTPEQMDKALHMEVPKSDFITEYNNAAGHPVNIDLIVADAVESYAWIYANYQGLKGNQSLSAVKMTPQYLNFITKVRYMYSAISDTFDTSIAYPWVLYVFTGMTEQQVRQLTRESIDWQMTQPIKKVTWTSPASLPGKAGVVSVAWKNGLRLLPEMQDLFRAFRDAGMDVWVCTASFVDLIKEISSNPAYGYHNPADHVLGMELERDGNGIIQTEFRKGYAHTLGKGKTQAIRQFLLPKYGYGPFFVAGDSEGDINMMQDFADTQLIMIINRLKGKDISIMSKKAVETYGNPDARILLQGRNDNTGEFVKSQSFIKYDDSKHP